MRSVIKILFFLIFSTSVLSVNAQELNCNVQINSSQIQGSDKSIFDAMQKAIFEFMNSRKFTNNVFKSTERIECTIMINITEQVSINDFKATIQIQSRRPIYNTSYFTTTLNHLDKDFSFRFNEFDPLEYSETTFLSNLTSVLSFYANIIIALDYDSFSMKGGSRYLQKAQAIVGNSQGAREAGWKAFEGERNRYWFVENLLHQNYVPLRECFYKYHRLGFDLMAKNVQSGRAVVLNSLKLLEQVYDLRPGNFQLQIFFNAKSNEIVDLFIEALPKEKSEVTNLLNKIDANNLSKYEKITKGK
ncbi:MAG: DUF4835 domain-containing protein [Flavobacteriales bacterium]|nr:MAG: DUF4835 domain-containing protein [Flavobacteriales bacterium]